MIGDLTRAGESSGLSWSDVIQLSRSVIVVEGVHDELVLRQFFSDQLKKRRAVVVPIHGIFRFGTPAVEFMARFGKPLRIMFDNVSEAALSGAGHEDISQEAQRSRKILIPLRGLTTEPAYDIKAIPFDLPDIAFALPDDAMRRLIIDLGGEAVTFPGFEAVASAFRDSGTKEGCKDFLLKAVKLQGTINAKTLVPELLARCDHDDVASPILADAVRKCLDDEALP
jgi:hypothetical protein